MSMSDLDYDAHKRTYDLPFVMPFPENLGSPPDFSGVCVTRFLVLYVHVCFVDRCLSFCPFGGAIR
jgi:hypothetical protein